MQKTAISVGNFVQLVEDGELPFPDMLAFGRLGVRYMMIERRP